LTHNPNAEYVIYSGTADVAWEDVYEDAVKTAVEISKKNPQEVITVVQEIQMTAFKNGERY